MVHIVKDGKLISRTAWHSHVNTLRSSTPVSTKSKQQLKTELQTALLQSISSTTPTFKFGLLLSGGVDSSLIAFLLKKHTNNFVCYSVGTKNSKDLVEAKKVARKLKLKLRDKIFSLGEVEEIVHTATKIIGPNVVNVGVASVEIAAATLAKKDNIKILYSGLGSEEIFAGYQRHETSDVNTECWNGLQQMYDRDLIRDYKVAKLMKVKFIAPLLSSAVIRAAMQVPGKYKINKKEKKIILRETASELGLPKEIAFRKKIAAQYGSGFDKAIGKLAKMHGFKYKTDYLRSL